jgi:hypothetical protein
MRKLLRPVLAGLCALHCLQGALGGKGGAAASPDPRQSQSGRASRSDGGGREWATMLAGGLAGAVSTASLHPLDTAKTLRQADPHTYKGSRAALSHLWRTHGPLSIYAGVIPAILGSIPSSALYFGGYETAKRRLTASVRRRWEAMGGSGPMPLKLRAPVFMLSAACGNVCSSLVFVPKEFLKQTMQVERGAALAGAQAKSALSIIRDTLAQQGVGGLYKGYWPTLSRNIPSAVLRFTIYEELKLHMGPPSGHQDGSMSVKYLAAGAGAGALASAITTPFDVVKTMVATGRIPRDLGIMRSLVTIAKEEGFLGLYAGVQPRVAMSALFTGVGFASFEVRIASHFYLQAALPDLWPSLSAHRLSRG